MGNVNECHTVIVKNLIKENFYRKRKKKQLMFWQFFFISHKSNVKIFLKWILKQCHTALINMTKEIYNDSILSNWEPRHYNNCNWELKKRYKTSTLVASWLQKKNFMLLGLHVTNTDNSIDHLLLLRLYCLSARFSAAILV